MAGARPRGGIQARLRDRLGAAAAAAGRRALVAARGETAQRLGRLAALTMALAVLVVVLYDHGDVPTASARGAAGQAGVAAGADGAAVGSGSAAPGRSGPEASGRAGPGDAGSATDPARPGAGPGESASGGRGNAAASGGRGDAATSGGRGAAATAGGRAAAGERAPAKLKRPARPAEVAAAWYAARHRLPRSRVRPLQQDRVSARQVRVLVLAEAANGRLQTALVRVRLGPGGWEVR